jgi:hypothetical protein
MSKRFFWLLLLVIAMAYTGVAAHEIWLWGHRSHHVASTLRFAVTQIRSGKVRAASCSCSRVARGMCAPMTPTACEP